MKILKKILIILAAIVALFLIVAAFVKSEYSVEKEVIINKPKQEVFDYVKYLKNQNSYSKWALIDPAMKKEFRGVDASAGFVSAWESDNKNVGKGEQEITKIEDGRIDYEIRFIKPFSSVAPAYMITEPAGDNQTRVRWGFQGKMPYPMNIMMLFMDIPKLIGEDLQTGLNNLKGVLEKQ
jgi:hypothetical protein